MENAWRVVWRKNGKRVRKTFQGDLPRPAIDFAKKVKAAGFLDVEVHSVRKAFPIPASKLKERKPGHLWCPYCLKWREFKMLAVRFSWGVAEPALRCPLCYISTEDAFVKKYNLGSNVLAHAEIKPVKIRVNRNSPASKANIRRRR